MGIPQVEVGLDEGLMDLEGEIARQNGMLNASIDPEGELVGEEQMCSYNYRRFILTKTRQPKRVRTEPTVTGRRAGSLGSMRSSISGLWKGYMSVEARYTHRPFGSVPLLNCSASLAKRADVEGR